MGTSTGTREYGCRARNPSDGSRQILCHADRIRHARWTRLQRLRTHGYNCPRSNCTRDLSKVATYHESPPAGPAPAHTVPPGHQSGDIRYSANLAGLVAAGILLSRIAGLIRESIFAHYLGNSAAADAFKAGFRIPNILQ